MKVIIATGGTGGHVFPGVCIANELRKNNVSILFATDKRGVKYLGDCANKAIIQKINTSSRYLLYISLLKEIVSAVIYLLKNRYDCVIGFGGYPSVPYVLAAQILRKKTIIHEQNAAIGKANKLLSRLASRIITSFENTKNLKKSNKIINIGTPTRFESMYDLEEVHENGDFTILVIGGSQGAQIFSKLVTHALCDLKESNIMIYSQVIEQDIDFVKKQFQQAQINHEVKSFFNNIDALYKKADLVIARAGASSIFEIIGFKKPAILIPYKKSINGDQEENAKFLLKNDAAIVVDELNITSSDLKEMIKKLINNPKKLTTMKKNLEKIYTSNITKKVVSEILNTLK
ncbi:MAG: undecaprenyldiphospho-muramoylpentapeptide beta-N-acetylglucosaminyltransferase [Holosporales bacterium]|jgi:UDP-N-acetylglucosamine--N-acetylmuramyl-(pentapeptide) pyrophosphoryl-undecaprenol N-acetylglucosamine transferase|nr:undecaprenyldiphospho-muramoylpentapeptide beta-N-acetylglucosaminyltransferase [Holosporales bacterium]